MTTTIANFNDTATGWQRAFYAFLAEKRAALRFPPEIEGYSRILQDFFGRSGKQSDNMNSQDIFVHAHSPGLSGKQPSAITIGALLPGSVRSSVSNTDGHSAVKVLVTNCSGHKPHLQYLEVCPVTRCITFGSSSGFSIGFTRPSHYFDFGINGSLWQRLLA